MNDKLTAKTTKFTSLENLYIYGIYCDLQPATVKVKMNESSMSLSP